MLSLGRCTRDYVFLFEKHSLFFYCLATQKKIGVNQNGKRMCIFFPLKILTCHQGEYGVEDNPMEITPAEAVAYEDAILVAIAKERGKKMPNKNKKGQELYFSN